MVSAIFNCRSGDHICLQFQSASSRQITDKNGLPTKSIGLSEHGTGAVRPDGHFSPFCLSSREPGTGGVLAGQIVTPFPAILFMDKVFYLLSPVTYTNRNIGHRYQLTPSGNSLHDGPFNHHRLFACTGDCRHGHRLRSCISGFQS